MYLRKTTFFIFFILIILFAGTSYGKEKTDSALNHEKLSAEIKELKKELIEIKKELKGIISLLKSRVQAKRPKRATRAKTTIKDDPFLGKADAPLTLVEFSDFQCPFCRKFFTNTLPELKKNYINTGKMKYVFKDLPLSFHKQAQKAAEASHCAGDAGKYWEMHDRLFTKPREQGISNLIRHAKDLGLDVHSFEKCLNDGKYAESIKKDIATARTNGLTGTPSFVLGKINNKGEVEGKIIRGAVPYETFKSMIETALK